MEENTMASKIAPIVAASPVAPPTTKFSMIGYSFKEFLKGNKESAKLILMALAAFSTYGANLVKDPVLNGLVIALAAAITKFGLDAFDYWLKDDSQSPA